MTFSQPTHSYNPFYANPLPPPPAHSTRQFNSDATLFPLHYDSNAFGARIEPSHSHKTHSNYSPSQTYSRTNLYIRPLPPYTTPASLTSLGAAFGPITSVRPLYSPQAPQTCRGSGFIAFEKEEDAWCALKGLNEKGWNVAYAKLKPKTVLKSLADDTNTNVYLTNIPHSYSESHMLTLFYPTPIRSIRILRDEFHQSKGVGFVRLFDRKAAETFIKKFDGILVPDGIGWGCQQLGMRFADTQEQRAYKLKMNASGEKKWNNGGGGRNRTTSTTSFSSRSHSNFSNYSTPFTTPDRNPSRDLPPHTISSHHSRSIPASHFSTPSPSKSTFSSVPPPTPVTPRSFPPSPAKGAKPSRSSLPNSPSKHGGAGGKVRFVDGEEADTEVEEEEKEKWRVLKGSKRWSREGRKSLP